jgi:hypothetical protein
MSGPVPDWAFTAVPLASWLLVLIGLRWWTGVEERRARQRLEALWEEDAIRLAALRDAYRNPSVAYRNPSVYEPPVIIVRRSGDEIGAKIHKEQVGRLKEYSSLSKPIREEGEKKWTEV